LNFNKAIELEPNNASFYDIRALIYRLKFRQFDSALQDYNRAIQLEPNNSTFYSHRAIFELFELQLKDKANIDFNKAIELDSEDRDNYYYRIKSFIFYEDFENALKDIQKTILLDKNDPEGYYDLFVIYKKQKKYLQALLQISKAIELLDGSSYEISDDKTASNLEIEDLYIFRAELYKLLSDYESTCEDYKNALNSIKDNSPKKKEIELLIKENCK
jgi:Flp pilus assembly protein TadD